MRRNAFTLIEIMIVIAIVAIVATVTTLNLYGNRSKADLDNATKDIGTLLRQAQSDSLSEKQGASWGVHFDNTNSAAPFYSLFWTTNGTYSSSNEVGHYQLPGDLCYATSTVPAGSSTNILFSVVSGAPTAGTSTSINLQLQGCGTASASSSAPTITQSGSGEIFFDDFNRANL